MEVEVQQTRPAVQAVVTRYFPRLRHDQAHQSSQASGLKGAPERITLPPLLSSERGNVSDRVLPEWRTGEGAE